MTMRLIRVFLCGLLIFLFSCTLFKKPDVDTVDRKTEISRAERASAEFLSAGDFWKSLEAYKEVYRKYGRDSHVQRGISGVVAAILERADGAYRNEDFAVAGRLCLVLLQHTHLRGAKGEPFFDAETVGARLAGSSDRLTKRGLEYYRKGELKRAVAAWENVLEFDPGNVEVRKAVATASGQLEILK